MKRITTTSVLSPTGVGPSGSVIRASSGNDQKY